MIPGQTDTNLLLLKQKLLLLLKYLLLNLILSQEAMAIYGAERISPEWRKHGLRLLVDQILIKVASVDTRQLGEFHGVLVTPTSSPNDTLVDLFNDLLSTPVLISFDDPCQVILALDLRSLALKVGAD